MRATGAVCGWGGPLGQKPPTPSSPVDPRSGDWGPPGDRSGWRKLKTGELYREMYFSLRTPTLLLRLSPGGRHQRHPAASQCPAGQTWRRPPTCQRLARCGDRTYCRCCSEVGRPQCPGGRQLQYTEEVQLGFGSPTHPPIRPPGPQGLTMTIGQVLHLHEVGLEHLKTHEQLGQQHHQVDLEVGGWVSRRDTPGPRCLRRPRRPQDGLTLSGGGTYSKSSRDRGQPRGRREAQKSCTSWRLYRLSATDMGSFKQTSVGTGGVGS